jgi:hypothetical protein
MRSCLLLLLITACSDQTAQPPVVDSSVPVCTVSAMITSDPGERTVSGVGTANCDHAANLTIEVCTQYASAGAPTFTDIMCETTTQTESLSHAVTNLSACLVGTDKSYRARVNLKIDGLSQPEKLSTTVSCD